MIVIALLFALLLIVGAPMIMAHAFDVSGPTIWQWCVGTMIILLAVGLVTFLNRMWDFLEAVFA